MAFLYRLNEEFQQGGNLMLFQTQNYFAIPNRIPVPFTPYPDITHNNETSVQFFLEPRMLLFILQKLNHILHILLINL